MSLFLVDMNEPLLQSAIQKVKGIEGVGEVHSMKVDVSSISEVTALRENVLDVYGEVCPSLPSYYT